jgi:predicted PurR-regulated permease PerM
LPDPSPAADRPALTVHVSLRSVAGAVAILLLTAAFWQLRWFGAMVVLALIGAVTLAPIMTWLEKRGVPHGLAVAIVALGLTGLAAGMWVLVVPPLVSQVQSLGDSFTQVQDALVERAGESPIARKMVQQAMDYTKSEQASSLVERGWDYGFAALEGFSGLIVVLVLGFYLLLDGRRQFAWLVSYVPRPYRRRVGSTAAEVAGVVRAYVRGQLITSAAAGIFMFVSLTLLKVPAAIPLALLAAAMDVLPVLGIIVTAVPTALVAATVSPTAGLAVVGLLMVYHAIENYLLVPVVYGNQLKLSTLSVLLAFLAGGILGGAVGAVLALPFVAAYPIIERHWLSRYLADETVDEHARMESDSNEQAKRAVDQVAADARKPA